MGSPVRDCRLCHVSTLCPSPDDLCADSVSAGELRLWRRRGATTDRGNDEPEEDRGGSDQLKPRRRLAEDQRGKEDRADRLKRERDGGHHGREPWEGDRNQQPPEHL